MANRCRDVREIDRAGYYTIDFAVKRLLDDCENKQFHLTADNFAKLMMGRDIHDNGDFVLSRIERMRYKNQLKKVIEFFNDENWKCYQSTGRRFKVIFERR